MVANTWYLPIFCVFFKILFGVTDKDYDATVIIPADGQNQVVAGISAEQPSMAGEKAESKQSQHARWQHSQCYNSCCAHGLGSSLALVLWQQNLASN